MPAAGAVLNGPWPIAAGAGVIGVTTVGVLWKEDDPINPSSPSRWPLSYSVTTALTRFRGWSTSYPFFTAT